MPNRPHDKRRTRWLSVIANRVIQSVIFSCSLILLFASCVLAQAPDDSASRNAGGGAQSKTEGIQKRWNEFGFWGGMSFDATTLIGKTPDAKFGNVGLRYGRVLAASKTIAFEWTIEPVPLSILSNQRSSQCLIQREASLSLKRARASTAGAPRRSVKFNFRRNRRVQPFGQTTGGFLYFNEDVPVSGAKRFNFTFDLAGGVQIVNSNRSAFTIGYKYEHISNGYRSSINPGVDVQMIYAGFFIFR
ncbi:MAG TPA: acyloxyacyl hydrolase [Pyrinomonadaceae bacterium]|nr:acyloxyacyl hydrolase [Pyrinomonadaceae bacterium]